MGIENRKKVEAFILAETKKVLPDGYSTKFYEESFKKMSDKQFDTWMKSLKAGGKVSLISPNGLGEGMTIERNLAILDKYKRKIFHHIELSDENGGRYVTPIPYLVIDLPVRRQEQSLTKKIGVAEDNDHVDVLTGQPTGASKGSRFSFPQIQMSYSQGGNESIRELIKFRAGDAEGYKAMEKMIAETGMVDLDALPEGTTPQVVDTISTLLKAMHIDNTLKG